MDEMDQMINDLGPVVTNRDTAIIVTSVAVIIGAPYVASYLLRRRARKNATVLSYNEFKKSKDQYAHLYTNPSMN